MVTRGSAIPNDVVLGKLDEDGFVVVQGPLSRDEMACLESDYERYVTPAAKEASIGRTTIRVNNVLEWNPYIEKLCMFGPVLDSCSQVIRQPFKLSTIHARSVFPLASEQELHVDCAREAKGFPLVGFIYMIDDFTTENGATRFVKGSHKWPGGLTPTSEDLAVTATGKPGSVIIYDGLVWHGHSANRMNNLRRSVQGAYISNSLE